MRRILTGLAALLLLAGFSVMPARADVGPQDQRYVTFSFGRGLSSAAVNCQVPAGAVPVRVVATWMGTLGVTGSLNVVPAYADAGIGQPYGRACIGGSLYTSWQDIRDLQAAGWQHQTSGRLYRWLGDLTAEQQADEVCGALAELDAHGVTGVRGGTFAGAAPDNGLPPITQQQVVDVLRPCGFPLGRDYGGQTWPYQPLRPDGTRVRVDVRGLMSPYFSRTLSINGGSCQLAVCGPGGSRTYMQPAEILRDLTDAPPGSHATVQFYQLVTGNFPGDHKCAGPPDTHWTSRAEYYCYEDFRAVLSALPADYVTAGPQTVAAAWGLVS